MRNFDVVIAGSGSDRPERLSMQAPGPASLMEWAQRHAAGREVEFFEDQRSLGRVSFSAESGVWTIHQASPGAD